MSKPSIEELETILNKPDDYYKVNQLSDGSIAAKVKFKYRLKCAAEEGLLLSAKYALVLFLAFIALNYLTSIISGATNGTQAVLYLKELQDKGYVPKAVNGQIPPKNEEQNAKTSQ